jgi:transcriptional regulator with XRE-family HTH domain
MRKPSHQDTYFGERIREARIAAKLTQEQLGELMGVSFQQIQKYETGKNRVSSGRIGLLVKAVNRPLAYFFPDSADIRMISDSGISSFLAHKRGQMLAHDFMLISPPAQDAVLRIVSILKKDHAND